MAQTWEICQERIDRSRMRKLARPVNRDMVLFLDRFKTILHAYRSGAMEYGCFVFDKPADPRARQNPVARLLGISTGVAVHALFAWMVYYLYFFLAGTPAEPGNHAALGIDALLALQFVVVHSLLLWPNVRTRLDASFRRPSMGCSSSR